MVERRSPAGAIARTAAAVAGVAALMVVGIGGAPAHAEATRDDGVGLTAEASLDISVAAGDSVVFILTNGRVRVSSASGV